MENKINVKLQVVIETQKTYQIVEIGIPNHFVLDGVFTVFFNQYNNEIDIVINPDRDEIVWNVTENYIELNITNRI